MKNLLLSSVLGLAALGLSAAPSQAWTFGLIPEHCCLLGGHCGRCGGKCSATVRITPYNAFTPTITGNANFNGCNPFCCGGLPPFNPYNGGFAYPGAGQGGFPGFIAVAGGGAPMFGQSLPACNGCAGPEGATGPVDEAPVEAAPDAAMPESGPDAKAKPYRGAAQPASYQTGASGYNPYYYYGYYGYAPTGAAPAQQSVGNYGYGR